MWCKEVERLLITELEKVEGRVPNNEEVQEFASCAISPDGTRHYRWKDKSILVVKPWKLSESGKFTLDYLLPKP